MKRTSQTECSRNITPRVIAPFEIIKNDLAKVSSLIREQLICYPNKSKVNELLRYVTGRTGKMLRPGLVLLAGRCFGKTTKEHIRVAAVFEIIHEATLVHDDVIDQAQTRRGKKSINCIYGNESAVLLGDFLLSKVFEMCTKFQSPIAREIASAASKTCRGELDQNLQRYNWQMDEKTYLQIISNKTAAIFTSCCQLGALLAGASPEYQELLGDFGLNFGIAFQIMDDLADIYGNKVATGKNHYNDFETAKPTLALIHFLHTAKTKDRAELVRILSTNNISKTELISTIKSKLQKTASFEYSKQQAERYINKAILRLSPLPQSQGKIALTDTAKFILTL